MLEAVAYALLDFAVSDQSSLHPVVEPDSASDTAASRMVHCDVGTAENIRNADAARQCGRDPCKSSDLNDAVVDEQWPRDDPEDQIGEHFGMRDVRRRKRQCHRELVSTEPRDDRIGAQLIAKLRGYCL